MSNDPTHKIVAAMETLAKNEAAMAVLRMLRMLAERAARNSPPYLTSEDIVAVAMEIGTNHSAALDVALGRPLTPVSPDDKVR